MSEEDLDVLGPEGQGSAARVDRDRRAPRFSWTPAYEATFFRSLCESVQLGLRENSSFKAEAWERAAQALQESHAALPAKSHLINKSDNARKRFRLWRGLREDPDFVYSPTTRTVTATEEAWAAHIEREPLSRALRGRPFDHEEYMEILYPDVIGSGGAPKRIMKPRRRADGQPGDDSDMPGTSILSLQGDLPAIQSGLNSPEQSRPSLSQTPTGSSSGSINLQRPTSTTIPPRTGVRSTSVLTPPDETVPTTTAAMAPASTSAAQNRKRPLKADETPSSASPVPVAPAGVAQNTPQPPSSPDKRRKTSEPHAATYPISTATSGFSSGLSATRANSSFTAATSPPVPPAAPPPASSSDTSTLGNRMLVELLEAVKARASGPRWREEALDLFFRDFSHEELDLQIKISENVLSNENKAMVFCKMPLRVRQHWVKRFRELHHKAV
ncbi:L10-interacting MYB domain-containing protein [Paramyrothecium foliicola]|nr:L10-interacting MYB domain-containing protein [Paramyrothecium foliicola]